MTLYGPACSMSWYYLIILSPNPSPTNLSIRMFWQESWRGQSFPLLILFSYLYPFYTEQPPRRPVCVTPRPLNSADWTIGKDPGSLRNHIIGCPNQALFSLKCGKGDWTLINLLGYLKRDWCKARAGQPYVAMCGGSLSAERKLDQACPKNPWVPKRTFIHSRGAVQ